MAGPVVAGRTRNARSYNSGAKLAGGEGHGLVGRCAIQDSNLPDGKKRPTGAFFSVRFLRVKRELAV